MFDPFGRTIGVVSNLSLRGTYYLIVYLFAMSGAGDAQYPDPLFAGSGKMVMF